MYIYLFFNKVSLFYCKFRKRITTPSSIALAAYPPAFAACSVPAQTAGEWCPPFPPGERCCTPAHTECVICLFKKKSNIYCHKKHNTKLYRYLKIQKSQTNIVLLYKHSLLFVYCFTVKIFIIIIISEIKNTVICINSFIKKKCMFTLAQTLIYYHSQMFAILKIKTSTFNR